LQKELDKGDGMSVDVEVVTPTKVSLTIEVEAEKVKNEKEKVFQLMSKQVQIKGFRKGKAPRKIVEKWINADVLNKEVLERLVSNAYGDALKANHLIPVTQPQVEIVHFSDNESLKFKATFEKRPEVALPEYKGIEIETENREITVEEVEKTLQTLRDLKGIYETVPNGVVQEGRAVLLDFEGTVEDKPFKGGNGKGVLLEVKKDWVIPEFMEQMLGMKAGEEKKVDVTIPPHFEPEIAGKQASFKVVVHEVKEKKLPELADSFAQSFGEFKTMEDLKQAIREQIKTTAEHQKKEEALQNILDQFAEAASFPVPPIFIEERLKQMERTALQFLQEQKKSFTEFLKEKYPETFALEGITEEEKNNRAVAKFREELHPKASKMAKIDLILDEIWKKENITITKDEVNAEIARLASHYKMPVEAIQKTLKDEQVYQSFLVGILRAKASFLIRDSLKLKFKEKS
jgi:trigger factor